MSTRHGKLGITLTELMISLAVIAILALIAVPLLTTLLQNYRISAYGDQLYYQLQYAKSEAIKRNTNVYVSFITGDTWCYGINLGSTCTCTTANSCGLGTVSYNTAQQASLSASGLSGSYVYFEGSHSAANASGSLTFTAYGQSSPLITVSIGRLGGLQVCATGLNGYGAC